MGADSVAYHQATVMGRSDDHPGQALDYYASRGETPLVWGGGGAARLGLNGRVTEEEYAAIYGPGGARHPATGQQLAATRRPGMELVVSAHKSVAELGVIGRAEDMHRILDAERDATLAYLEGVTRQRGGRRGRLALKTPTSGLVYAHTRHATSRAGDPCPHDHVLIANLVEMLDGEGGWKAADSVLWRDHLHAATMAGRVAAARVAVQLGYAIEADPGPSGRLGHWRIAGMPDEVLAMHSKRAEEITESTEARGYSSYRARNITARDNREVKRHTPVGELMPRWYAELAEAGWTVTELAAAVDNASQQVRPAPALTEHEVIQLMSKAFGPESRLSTEKVFTAADVVVAVAPKLYGRPLDDLPRLVGRILACPDAVPFIGVRGARDRAFATAATLATETAIAEVVARNTVVTGAAVVPEPLVDQAVRKTEAMLGRPLTSGQAAAVRGICAEGRRLSLVLGVAGAGKTTAIGSVADAYAAAGYTVVGTATSGQAARTLGREAAVESRTLASLLWRLDHHTLNLTSSHVVVLDEAGMTDDPAMLRLLTACEVAGAKIVLTGDHRQLGPVGPGGALRALLNRHAGQVHVLDENIRQYDPGERVALAQLRRGDVGAAVRWYADHDRIHTAPDRGGAIRAMVDAWAADTAAGHHTAMYAWRRSNVEELNRRARTWMALNDQLAGPDLRAPGGAHYSAGDRIVTLAPAAGGKVVTSEHGIVEAVDRRTHSLVVRMDDGRLERLTGDDLGLDRLAHGYAITIHRAQASTVERAHRLEDGGGRDLAYVSMSRARQTNTVHVVADDLEQAVEDLTRDWAEDRRARWAIDTGTPAREPVDVERDTAVPAGLREALRLARLRAHRQAIESATPPDRAEELRIAEVRLSAARRARRDLEIGQGRYVGTPEGEAARNLDSARTRRRAAEHALDDAANRRTRRHWRKAADELAGREAAAQKICDSVARPEAARLDQLIHTLEGQVDELRSHQSDRTKWLTDHPEARSQREALDRELNPLSNMPQLHQELSRILTPRHEPCVGPGNEHGPDLGIDIGL